MPKFWIDVETPAGVRLGSGPITGALDWEWKAQLDGAGTFSFTVPASDPQTVYLTGECVVRCRAIRDGVVTDHGMGIVRKIERQVGEVTMLRVSGPDILAELADLTVHNLQIKEQAWVYLNDPTRGTLFWIHRGADLPPPTPYWSGAYTLACDGNLATFESMTIHSRTVSFIEEAAYIYVGYDARFSAIRFDFHGAPTPTAAGDTLYLQYYNGSGWAQLTPFVDGTYVTGTWMQTGNITFTAPADWERYNEAVGGAGNWFWVRIKLNQNGPDDPRGITADVHEVSVYADFPTLTGVELIMDIATVVAAGWTISPHPCNTVWEKYLLYNGESVLTALLMLAEQGGVEAGQAIKEHFRLGTGRVVEWLGTTKTSSGLRAVSVRDPIAALGAPELVLITEGGLTETEDTSELIERVYGYSGDGISLALSDRTPPAGYAEGHVHIGIETFYYVEHTAGTVLYGLMELVQRFGDLTMQQADSLTAHPTFVANAVYDRSIELLRTHAMVNKFYSLDVVQFPVFLKPGQLIDVVYHEFTDAVHTVDIDTIADASPLWILAPTLRITQDGVWTTGLDVATVDRDAQTDAGVVVGLVRDQNRSGGNTSNVVISGIGSPGASTPPTAGPDIRVSGYQVSRAGAGVLLFSGSGLVLREYAADATGLTAALAAAASGDIVEIPVGTITANITVGVGRILRGQGKGKSFIAGLVTGNGRAVLARLSVERTVDQAGALVGVTTGAYGTFSLQDVRVDVRNTIGPAYAIEMTQGGNIVVDGELYARIGTVGYAAWVSAGNLYHDSGRAKGTVATHPYWLEV